MPFPGVKPLSGKKRPKKNVEREADVLAGRDSIADKARRRRQATQEARDIEENISRSRHVLSTSGKTRNK